jgi:hypothetical protein
MGGCVKSSIPARQLQPTWIKLMLNAVSYTGGNGVNSYSKCSFKGEYVICGDINSLQKNSGLEIEDGDDEESSI